MRDFLRLRNLILIGGTLAVMVFLYLTDPNGGALTTTLVAQLATPVIAVWFAHIARRALFDYIDMKALYQEAKSTPIGAALTFLSVCMVIYALLGLFGQQVRAETVTTKIPVQAYQHIPTLKTEQQTLWVSHPKSGI